MTEKARKSWKAASKPKNVTRKPRKSKRAYETSLKPLIKYFDEYGFPYELDSEGHFTAEANLDGEGYRVTAVAEEGFFTACVHLLDNVPVERRLAVAETIMRANFQDHSASFGMYFENGTVILTRYFLNPDGTLDSDSAGLALVELTHRAGAFIESFRAVVSGAQTPVQAVAMGVARYHAE